MQTHWSYPTGGEHVKRVEVLDINDHSPTFQENEITLEISESVFPGARFQLKAARDPDSGHFSVQHYKLNQNENFRLEVKDKVFFSDAYSVSLRENVPLGTTVVQVNATDLDEGTNGEVIYSLGKSMNQHTLKLFDINSIT
ncbi:hypothetical protein GOODEAATRI_033420, partial [Goodea atripinnis]